MKRGDVYAGKFYWPFFFFSFSPPRRARSGNGMRQHGMLPQDPVAVFGFHGLRASKSEFSGGGVGFRCFLLKFRIHTQFVKRGRETGRR